MIALLMGVKTLSPARLQALLARQAAVVFDVNSAQSFVAAHLPGAIHLNASSFPASVLPTDRDALVVFYCSNPWCRNAPLAARRAKTMGHTQVRVLGAGIQGWRESGLPLEGGQGG